MFTRSVLIRLESAAGLLTSYPPWLDEARRHGLIQSPNNALYPLHEFVKSGGRIPQDYLESHLFFTTLPSAKALTEIEIWIDVQNRSSVSKFGIGKSTVGNKNIVHGGLLTTLLDEMMGATLFHCDLGPAATAYLHTNFRRIVRPGALLYGHCSIASVEGRKRKLEAKLLESLEEPPVVSADASSLFVMLAKT